VPILIIVLSICFLFAVLLFSPIVVGFDISRRRINYRLKLLGFRFGSHNGEKVSSFLFLRFKQSGTKKIAGSGEPGDELKKDEPKKRRSSFPISALRGEFAVIKKTIIAVIRFIVEILASVRIKKFSLRIVISGSDPALAGEVYGWICAVKYSTDFPIEIICDFLPESEWDFNAQFEARITLWRTAVLPILRLINRLPKTGLYKIYKKSKKLKNGVKQK
jgi:hypothetical protein